MIKKYITKIPITLGELQKFKDEKKLNYLFKTNSKDTLGINAVAEKEDTDENSLILWFNVDVDDLIALMGMAELEMYFKTYYIIDEK